MPVPGPTKEEMLQPFQAFRYGEVAGFRSFAFLPNDVIERLATTAMQEDWGPYNKVLIKYLAEHIPRAIDQDRWAWYDEHLILAAGRLQTRFGIQLYVSFERNLCPDSQPSILRWIGDRPNCQTP